MQITGNCVAFFLDFLSFCCCFNFWNFLLPPVGGCTKVKFQEVDSAGGDEHAGKPEEEYRMKRLSGGNSLGSYGETLVG